jgi:naphthalene 1,2-dioxygenase system ferredoxin subunit
MPTENWIDAMATADLPKDDVVCVEMEGRDLAIYTVGGDVYATDNLCTHGHARLCDGFLEGHAIECPLHQGKFDVRNGMPLCEPVTEPVRSYPVQIAGARVLVRLD